MGPDQPGQLVDTWSLGLGPRSQRTAGHLRGSSGKGPRWTGYLVDPAGTRTMAQVVRESRSTLQDLGPERESCSRAERHHGPSDPGLSHPGQLVNTVKPQTWEREPGTTGQHLGPSFTGPSLLGWLVDTAVTRPDQKLPGRVGLPRGTWDPSPSRPVQEVGTGALGPWLMSPGEQDEPAGPRKRARGIQDSWLNPRELGHGPEFPGKTGRHCRPSSTGLCLTGQLVDTEGPWT